MRRSSSTSSPRDAIHVALEKEDDVDAFLAQARMLAGEVPPEGVTWSIGESRDLFAATASAPPASAPPALVPEAFVDLALLVGLHRDPERFPLLYSLLWRLQAAPALLSNEADAQVIRCRDLAKSVRRDLHKMKAFVRFRRVAAPDGGEAFVAWFEPEHHIVAAVAPFFVKRFANMRWSILTPRASAHWDGEALTLGAGATRRAAARDDELEQAWRVYYASIFNPARLKVKAMTAQMPKKYWRNLPEATLIDPLIREAQARAAAMVEAAPTEPSRYAAAATARPADTEGQEVAPLSELAREEAACTRCPLYRNATQVVPGEGPPGARIMLVGEQPGDVEDLSGRPFVGPAGRVLDKALEKVGIPRERCFVTNAVKHFKFEPRGKRRLHKKPDAGEIDACRWWLARERAILAPGLIVALGATAIRGVLGRSEPVTRLRGQLIDLDADTKFLATIHPSFLLRLQEEEDKRREWARFLSDLGVAAEWTRAGDGMRMDA
ncbi:UdgX family uracil-DNA binding protein [Methylocystis parvus]|uniref:UdgX family uracil-DNA binding protein n=1 Tax=Methylocystis parvus TaxID=134 RepID=UPI003C757608